MEAESLAIIFLLNKKKRKRKEKKGEKRVKLLRVTVEIHNTRIYCNNATPLRHFTSLADRSSAKIYMYVSSRNKIGVGSLRAYRQTFCSILSAHASFSVY